LYHTCNTSDDLILLIVFDAPKFELALYERSGRLIFGSDRRGADFKSSHAALASGTGMLAQRRMRGKQAFTGLLTCRTRGAAGRCRVVRFKESV